MNESLKTMEKVRRAAQAIEDRERRLAAFIEQHGEISFMAQMPRHREGTFVVVAPCVHPGSEDKWQASFFDGEGAWGHSIDQYQPLLKMLVLNYKISLESEETKLPQTEWRGKA
jgi:hypothetical protein